MKIYTVTNHFYREVANLFSGIADVDILPSSRSEYLELPEFDLLVFTGGEDINPMKYGVDDPSIFPNISRDSLEFSVFSDFLRGRIKCKKIFGICRGMQLINVGMGGTLYTDLEDFFGKGHELYHEVKWSSDKEPAKSLKNFLPKVNSLHHQGIRKIGTIFSPTILAVEPTTNLVEAIMWGDTILGVQFHPELMPNSENKNSIAEIICSWVNNKERGTSSKDLYKEREIYSFNNLFTRTYADMPLTVNLEEAAELNEEYDEDLDEMEE